jgi:hypothetical protein
MRQPQILSRGSAFVHVVRPDSIGLCASRHVLHPYEFPWFYPSELYDWLGEIRAEHLSFEISLHDAASGIDVYRSPATKERYVAPDLDLGLVVFKRTPGLAAALQLQLDAERASSASLPPLLLAAAPPSPPRLVAGAPLTYLGYKFVGHDSETDSENSSAFPVASRGAVTDVCAVMRRVPGPRIVKVDQVFGSASENLHVGFCGGPVLHSGQVVGMVEGVVSQEANTVAVIPIDVVRDVAWVSAG